MGDEGTGWTYDAVLLREGVTPTPGVTTCHDIISAVNYAFSEVTPRRLNRLKPWAMGNPGAMPRQLDPGIRARVPASDEREDVRDEATVKRQLGIVLYAERSFRFRQNQVWSALGKATELMPERLGWCVADQYGDGPERPMDGEVWGEVRGQVLGDSPSCFHLWCGDKREGELPDSQLEAGWWREDPGGLDSLRVFLPLSVAGEEGGRERVAGFFHECVEALRPVYGYVHQVARFWPTSATLAATRRTLPRVLSEYPALDVVDDGRHEPQFRTYVKGAFWLSYLGRTHLNGLGWPAEGPPELAGVRRLTPLAEGLVIEADTDVLGVNGSNVAGTYAQLARHLLGVWLPSHEGLVRDPFEQEQLDWDQWHYRWLPESRVARKLEFLRDQDRFWRDRIVAADTLPGSLDRATRRELRALARRERDPDVRRSIQKRLGLLGGLW